MKSILVIADDFSGAAEIAGIGHRFGLPTRLFREPPGDVVSGLTVVDTDTRAMPDEVAATRVSNALRRINARRFDFVYKKIDSVLRGPVIAELCAAMQALDRPRCVLLPQNPSRGRTIEGGIYHINHVPLHQTEFALDPEHPATTSNVRGRIGLDMGDNRVEIIDAATAGDVARTAAAITSADLPVGGSEFFTAILSGVGLSPIVAVPPKSAAHGALFICGTASVQRDRLLTAATANGAACCSISIGTDPNPSVGSAIAAIHAGRAAVLYLSHSEERSKDTAMRLQHALVTAGTAVLARSEVKNLFAEGGATAAAMCQRLGWDQFAVEQELAPGVVQLRAIATGVTPLFIVKPGSYVWPDEVWH